MEASVISALLLLALLPSLFPAWRSVLIASACLLLLVFAGFVSVLWHFGATSAEGPAFLGLVLLTGIMAFILASSCVIRLVIHLTLSSLTRRNAVRVRRILVATGLVFAGLALLGILEASAHRGFAMMVGAASVWLLVVVAWLMPNNPASPTPLRGAA